MYKSRENVESDDEAHSIDKNSNVHIVCILKWIWTFSLA